MVTAFSICPSHRERCAAVAPLPRASRPSCNCFWAGRDHRPTLNDSAPDSVSPSRGFWATPKRRVIVARE